MEKSGEQDKGLCKEWLVNTKPDHTKLGLFSATIIRTVLSLALRFFLYLKEFKSNTTSDWLYHAEAVLLSIDLQNIG